tara:strand:+ start:775 stop:972 length:198 start_codon:yes stop_codon:yes gene_type:complete
MKRLQQLKRWLAETQRELAEINQGVWPDLGLAYHVSEEVLRASYEATMKAQERRFLKEIKEIEGQ